MSNEFKLVPRDPTEEMDIEGQSVIEYGASAVYSAMVEKYSPQPPALGGEPDFFVREVFLRNGFTIKEGQEDLKPYVYAAAKELTAPLQAEIENLKAELAWQETDNQMQAAEIDQLKARCDELLAFDIDAAARKLSECIGYPWFGLNIDARDGMRAHAKAVIDAALSKPAEGEQV